jgi:hypothetical protein
LWCLVNSVSQYGHLCFLLDGDRGLSCRRLGCGKLIPRRPSVRCACKWVAGYEKALFPSSGEVDSAALLLPASSCTVSFGAGLATLLEAVAMGAGALSNVPTLDKLAGLVWAVLSTCIVSEGVCWMFSATVARGSLVDVEAAGPACALLSSSGTLRTACLLSAAIAEFGLVRLAGVCSCISRCTSAIAAAAVMGAGLSLALFPGRGDGSWWRNGSTFLCPKLSGACGLRNADTVVSMLLVGRSLG